MKGKDMKIYDNLENLKLFRGLFESNKKVEILAELIERWKLRDERMVKYICKELIEKFDPNDKGQHESCEPTTYEICVSVDLDLHDCGELFMLVLRHEEGEDYYKFTEEEFKNLLNSLGYLEKVTELEKIRKERGFTKYALGKKAGVEITTITRTEKRKHIPYESTLQKFADGLGVDLSALTNEMDYIKGR